MLTDTHAHIYAEDFAEDLDNMLLRAREAGVTDIYMPNIDSTSLPAMLALAARHDWCHPMMGLHPCHVKENYKAELNIVEQELAKGGYCGVGEVGIDHYWDKTFISEQEEAFRWQVAAAREARLPVIIHSRESLDLTIAIIQEMQDGRLSGIFHCFNGTQDQGRRIMDSGFLMGIGGVITYKNAGVDKVVSTLPLDSMVLETDSPYLSPVPYRGKRNESAYVALVAQKLAELLEISTDTVAMVTTENAARLFNR